jgi:putative colanic acid biosynthesis acetyltransferase WcaF
MFDVNKNRNSNKWSRSELFGRMLWGIVWSAFFWWTPRQLWAWRRLLLRAFGARIGKQVHIAPSVRIAIPWNVSIGDQAAVGERVTLYSLGAITIGDRSTISQGAHICAGTHDYSDVAMPLLKESITIADDVWICADAFVGPGTTVGHRAVVGARAVVVRDVEESSIVAGNPARLIKLRPHAS